MTEENLEAHDEPPDDAPAGADGATASATPADLVAQMVAAGEWPEPELMEKIIQAGDAAVDPLLELLRTTPRGWPAEAPLAYAIDLLATLTPPRALPDLVAITRRYSNELCEQAAEALADFGLDAFEPLMTLLQEPTFGGYARTHVVDTLKFLAHGDVDRVARLSEQLRRILADAIERGREKARKYQAWKDRRGSIDEETSKAELNALIEEENRGGPFVESNDLRLDVTEEIAFLVGDLADLADPAARELIKTAFAENLVDLGITDAKGIDSSYQRGGEKPRRFASPEMDWLQDYRNRYEESLESRALAASRDPMVSTPVNFLSNAALNAPAESARPLEPPPVTAPIHNTNPKIGRNDPCWCGSGKKYKKCHLGKDNPA